MPSDPRFAQIAAAIPAPDAQRAVAEIMAIMGSDVDWSADTLSDIATVIGRFSNAAGSPDFSDQDDFAVSFWSALRY
jgi:hypothetical protein